MKETKEVNEMVFEGLTLRPIEQMGVGFKDIKIPDGWRIPTLAEGIMLVNNPDFVKWSRAGDGKHDCCNAARGVLLIRKKRSDE